MYVVFGLYVVDALFVILSHTALWQRKEYRLDRMRAHLLSPEGSLTRHPWWIGALVLLACGLISVAVDQSVLANTFAFVSMLSLIIGYSIRIVQRGVIRPKVTVRSSAVFLVAVLIALCLLYYAQQSIVLIALYVVAIPVVVAIAVEAIAIPSSIQKQSVIAKAASYRKQLSYLTVIGITGSVGKTSTKTYLLHILQQYKGEVVATREHRNSPFVVAQDLLSRVHLSTSLYIAEMGAYVPGEIAELCRLVRPRIGVITAITNQHVALFGSLEKLADTKWELAQGISETGTLVLNKDDETIIKKAASTDKNIVWFSMKQDADVMFKDCEPQEESTMCTLVIEGRTHGVTLPVISAGQVSSALAAVATAYAAGLSDGDITRQLFSLPPLPRTMERKRNRSESVMIDDSYSASEASVMNALSYMKQFGGKDARVILVPIIELGPEGPAVHERIGAMLATMKVRVHVYGDAYQQDMMRGLGKTPLAHVAWYDDVEKLMYDAKKDMNDKTVMLLEGRVPQAVREALL